MIGLRHHHQHLGQTLLPWGTVTHTTPNMPVTTFTSVNQPQSQPISKVWIVGGLLVVAAGLVIAKKGGHLDNLTGTKTDKKPAAKKSAPSESVDNSLDMGDEAYG